MDDRDLQDIHNYRRSSKHVATAGQPTETQLAAVAEAGCTAVINLGLHDADYALPDERGTVESLGLRYIHLPVLWEAPTHDDLERFWEILEAHEGEDIFCHCAANVRVSVFIALYRVARQGWTPEQALGEIAVENLPEVWQNLIDEVVRQPHS
jgi:protein tyrosine phosphatase (PTP) superfamily phosphohydrolase (DUF442 family)